MKQYLLISQIIVAIILTALIMLQQRGAALGSSFGGEGGFYSARRGMQKKMLWGSIAFGIVFIILAILNLAIK